MKIGYARVSTKDWNLDLQVEASEKVCCEKSIRKKIRVRQKIVWSSIR